MKALNIQVAVVPDVADVGLDQRVADGAVDGVDAWARGGSDSQAQGEDIAGRVVVEQGEFENGSHVADALAEGGELVLVLVVGHAQADGGVALKKGFLKAHELAMEVRAASRHGGVGE